MSTCTKWVDDGTIACTDWTTQASATCTQWADNGSYQCQTWADQGSNQCQSWADEGSNQCQSWADQGYNACCDWAPCSWFCDAFVWISNWVCQAWYWVANWVCQAWFWVANWVCQAWYWVANIVCTVVMWIVHLVCVVWSWVADWVCIAWDTGRCLVSLIVNGTSTPSGPIKHVFVLMLENRAFDHMLGFAGITGTDAVTGEPTHVDDLTTGDPRTNPNPNAGDALVAVLSPADFTLHGVAPDPGHEFNNALLQLCGYTRDESGQVVAPTYPDANGKYPPINNQGFIASYFGEAHQDGVTPDTADPERIMRCYDPSQVPVITALAKEFAVCDRWFSSLPGPTWPNRFFIHAASSGGLDDSPSNLQTVVSSLFNGYRFENGTIYDSLEDKCFDWTVFMGDELPQVFAISGMTDRRIMGHFDDFADFAEALNDPEFSVPYIFIEPNYGNVLPTTPGDFTCGNSQHPLDDVTRGERLIKTVYETIRNSPHWNDSVLVVTYDEQGGFFDHVAPPPVVSPGDVISDPDNNHHNFDFTQLGVRVPAIVVSPLIPKNLIDHTTYDHTSLLATVESLFSLPALTNRDAQAQSFNHLLSLQSPRTDAPTTLPDPADSGFRCEDDEESPTAQSSSRLSASGSNGRPIEPVLQAFMHVAFLRDYHHASLLARPSILRRYLSITDRAGALKYIQEVAARVPKPKRTVHRIEAMVQASFRKRK